MLPQLASCKTCAGVVTPAWKVLAPGRGLHRGLPSSQVKGLYPQGLPDRLCVKEPRPLPSCCLSSEWLSLSQVFLELFLDLFIIAASTPAQHLGRGWTGVWPWQALEGTGQAAFSFKKGSCLIPTKVFHEVSHWDLGERHSQSFPVPPASIQQLRGLQEAERKRVKEVRTQGDSCNAWESSSDAGPDPPGRGHCDGREKHEKVFSLPRAVTAGPCAQT